MARARTSGNGRLEEALAHLAENQSALEQGHTALQQAMATMVQNQATLVQTQAAFAAEMREMEAQRREMERRIDARFEKVMAVLDSLPNMIREISRQMGRMGFQATERGAGE